MQRELLSLHSKNLQKHDQVVSRHGIDTSLQSTEQLIRKLVNAPAGEDARPQLKQTLTRPGMEEVEDRLEESLEQLDCLLNGIKAGAKEQQIAKLGSKYNLVGDSTSGDGGGAYGKKKQLEQKQAFEYQQPFNLRQQEPEPKKAPSERTAPLLAPPRAKPDVTRPEA